jgi:hypothetical protein
MAVVFCRGLLYYTFNPFSPESVREKAIDDGDQRLGFAGDRRQ